MLVWWFVRKFSKKMDKRIELVPRATMEAFERHHWPGNVRELMNTVERSMIVSDGPALMTSLPISLPSETSEILPLREVERNHILEALKVTNWRVRGKGGAGELLEMKPTTLQSRMKKLGIRRPD